MAHKLAALRERMRIHNIDAYIIPSGDAHQSEYVTEYWRTRAWFSGFTGSNGLVVVTENDAGLWTDGRYFIQAQQQLEGSGIRLFKMDTEGTPDYQTWLAEALPENAQVGFDGRTLSVAAFEKLQESLIRKQIKYAYQDDLLNALWEDRPAMPLTQVFTHDLCFAGKTRTEKLDEVRVRMKKKDVDYYFIASLDDMAWLLNLRGGDIPYTPVAYGYCIVTLTEAHLFIASVKLDSSLMDTLAKDGVKVHPYESVLSWVGELPTGSCLMYDANRTNVRVSEAVPASVKVIRGDDITARLKAVKNDIEIANIRNAHIKEGVVMVRFLKWLEEHAVIEGLDEAGLHEVITRFRLEQAHYREPSFETIAAYGENAASMHYSPEPGRSKAIESKGFLLIDTGAQYLDGTTDITRTIVMGPITDEMKRDFTLVLKGHIALASAVFLSGVTGAQLDVLARAPLWAQGMNYKCGTGHGLGYFLGVHEGPHSISMRPNSVKLEKGMLVTDEPGVYKENRYGIRTENVLLVRELFTNSDGTFMGFEVISYCPIDLKAVDWGLLTAQERQFLNQYHEKVYEMLSPYLNDGEKEWLLGAINKKSPGCL